MLASIIEKPMFFVLFLCLFIVGFHACTLQGKNIERLIAQLGDEDEVVRRYAAHALGEIGSAAKGSVPALTKALSDWATHVQQAAANALRKIGTPEALEAIEEYKSELPSAR